MQRLEFTRVRFYCLLSERVPFTFMEPIMANTPETRWWNQPIVVAAVVTALASMTVAFVGAQFTDATSQREVGARFVTLAVDILREDPVPEKAGIRSWAVDVLNSYSGVPIPAIARDELIGQVPLTVGVLDETNPGGRVVAGDWEIPRRAEYFYVFLQRTGPVEQVESTRLASALPREQFLLQAPEFQALARQRNMRLIITATDAAHRGWYQPQIRYRGENLRVVMYKSPDEERVFPGAEVPLR